VRALSSKDSPWASDDASVRFFASIETILGGAPPGGCKQPAFRRVPKEVSVPENYYKFQEKSVTGGSQTVHLTPSPNKY